MEQKKQFRPQNLRSLLATLLVIIFIAGVAGFYFGLQMVKDYSAKVNQRLADAEASGKQVEQLQTLRQQLINNSTLITKANQVFAAPETYQSQALNDIRVHAASAGVSIATSNFSTDGSTSVTVTLVEPVSYTSLITFLSNLESNLPKLQVSSINLQRSEGGADSIVVGDIKIDITVR